MLMMQHILIYNVFPASSFHYFVCYAVLMFVQEPCSSRYQDMLLNQRKRVVKQKQKRQKPKHVALAVKCGNKELVSYVTVLRWPKSLAAKKRLCRAHPAIC